jgi:hypothetical protein
MSQIPARTAWTSARFQAPSATGPVSPSLVEGRKTHFRTWPIGVLRVVRLLTYIAM